MTVFVIALAVVLVIDAVFTERRYARNLAALDAQIARLHEEREEWKRACADALDTSGAP